jgi:hypothetical protein
VENEIPAGIVQICWRLDGGGERNRRRHGPLLGRVGVCGVGVLWCGLGADLVIQVCQVAPAAGVLNTNT